MVLLVVLYVVGLWAAITSVDAYSPTVDDDARRLSAATCWYICLDDHTVCPHNYAYILQYNVLTPEH